MGGLIRGVGDGDAGGDAGGVDVLLAGEREAVLLDLLVVEQRILHEGELALLGVLEERLV